MLKMDQQQQTYRLIQTSDGQTRAIMQDELQQVVFNDQQQQQQVFYQIQQTGQPQQQIIYMQNPNDHQNIQQQQQKVNLSIFCSLFSYNNYFSYLDHNTTKSFGTTEF